MPVQVIVELKAVAGRRDELRALMERLIATQGASEGGFLGSTRYEVLDDPDSLVEIATWESAEARVQHMRDAASRGTYAPVFELLAAPFRALVVRELP